MKLVYCINSVSNSGGMERVLSNKVNYWVNLGVQVYVVTTDQRNKQKFFNFDPKVTFFDLGINYGDNNEGSVIKKIANYPFKVFRNYTKLKKLLKVINPDIVISMFDNDVWVVPFINDGSKKVLEIHFSKYWRKAMRRTGLWRVADSIRTWMNNYIIDRFDKFVVLTEEDKELWGYRKNIVVIPNALTFDSSDTSKLNSKRVLAIGRLDFQKNFQELIDIWSNIAKDFPTWNLTIIGGGKDKDALERRISDMNLNDSVSIVAPTRNVEMWYLDSSIYAMTSRYEGLPMVLIEAQSMGLPIISYACHCGPRDVITDGEDGFLIKYGDKDSFASKLREMMSDTDKLKSMGGKAKENSKRFDEDFVMDKWMKLFKGITS